MGLSVGSAYGEAVSVNPSPDSLAFGRLEWAVAWAGGMDNEYRWQATPSDVFLAPGWRYDLGGPWSFEAKLGLGCLYSAVSATELPTQTYDSHGKFLVGNFASGTAFGVSVHPELRMERLVAGKIGLGLNVGYLYQYFDVHYRPWQSENAQSWIFLDHEAPPSTTFNYETGGLAFSVFANYYYGSSR
jgi:hypothetical protein